LFLILFFIIKKSVLKKSDLIFLVLGLYLILLLVYSHGDILVSSKNLLAIILALLMIPVGRYIGERVDFLREFEVYNRFLLIILPIYIIICNIFGIGESYSEAFTSGFLVTSRMYIFPIVIFLAIHYVISNKDQSKVSKGIDIAFIIINILIIIINTRRTAIGMLILALLVYTILNRKIIFKMVILILFLVSTMVLSYPFYVDRLTAQLEERARILNLDTYEEEGRYVETMSIFDYYTRRQKISEILFGVKLFDTHEFGAIYFGRDRSIHSDINMILYSTGLIGIILFALFFIHYFLIGNKKIIKHNRKIYYAVLIMFLIVLIPGRFIGTLTFAPLLMFILAAVKAKRSDIKLHYSNNKFNALVKM
jgi:O-antigen ligase